MRAGHMTGGDKHIDLAAPLLSARRSDSLPLYKADLKSGPVCHPGAVPFVWEQRPGQPKSVRTRRPPQPPPSQPHPPPQEKASEQEIGTKEADRKALASRVDAAREVEKEEAMMIKKEMEEKEMLLAVALRKEEEEEEEEERYSDALDTLSRTESFAMNCSVSGLSGVDLAAGAEPGVRGFMMDRFLPAAQAVAVGSPQYTFRKAGATAATGASARELVRVGNDNERPRRLPVHLPYQHLPPNYVTYSHPRREEREVEDEEEEDDVHSTRGFASKGCGLLPGLCVKSSLLLLNPVPGMRRRGGRARGRERGFPSKGRGQKAPSPLARSAQNGHLGHVSSGRSWEDVYKHKLEQKYMGQGEDGRSKLTCESNLLTYWSDSQTGDGSSPFHHSTGGGVSPYHSDAVVSPSNRANGTVGGDKDEKRSRSNGGSLLGSDGGSLKGSGSMSLGLDRAVHEDSMDHEEDTDLKASHLALVLDTMVVLDASEYDSPLGEPVRATHAAKGQGNDSLAEKFSEVREPASSVPSKSRGPVKLDDRKNFKHDASQDLPLHLEDNIVVKKEVMPLQSLLPLPVPISPSESWLSRTLPSVTKKPPMPSFLGIQVQSKKQAPWDSMHPKENDLKHSRPRLIRFADVIENHNSLDSEI